MVGLILFFIIKQLEELIGICIIYPFLKHMALKIITIRKMIDIKSYNTEMRFLFGKLDGV